MTSTGFLCFVFVFSVSSALSLSLSLSLRCKQTLRILSSELDTPQNRKSVECRPHRRRPDLCHLAGPPRRVDSSCLESGGSKD